MFGSLFNSVASIATTAVKVVSAPVSIVVDVADAVTKPIGNAAEFVAKEISEITR